MNTDGEDRHRWDKERIFLSVFILPLSVFIGGKFPFVFCDSSFPLPSGARIIGSEPLFVGSSGFVVISGLVNDGQHLGGAAQHRHLRPGTQHGQSLVQRLLRCSGVVQAHTLHILARDTLA